MALSGRVVLEMLFCYWIVVRVIIIPRYNSNSCLCTHFSPLSETVLCFTGLSAGLSISIRRFVAGLFVSFHFVSLCAVVNYRASWTQLSKNGALFTFLNAVVLGQIWLKFMGATCQSKT